MQRKRIFWIILNFLLIGVILSIQEIAFAVADNTFEQPTPSFDVQEIFNTTPNPQQPIDTKNQLSNTQTNSNSTQQNPSSTQPGETMAESATSITTTKEQAVQTVTNPTAFTSSFQIQPSYEDLHTGGDVSQMLLRLVLPFHGFMIPGLGISDFYSIARFEAPFLNVNIPFANAAGFSDATFTDLAVNPNPWGAWAIGNEFVFPTATNVLLGQGKIQTAPTAGIVTRNVKNMLWGLFAQNFISIGGDPSRQNLNYLSVSPILVYYLPKSYFISTSASETIDWTNDGISSFPININIGGAITKHLTWTFTPQYVLSGFQRYSKSYQLNLNYVGW